RAVLDLSLLGNGDSHGKFKGFRAVTARATFLCLCKETWRKESTPRPARPVLCTGSAEPAGFSEEASCLRGKRRTSMCGAPAGSVPPPPPLRRGPEGQGQDQRQQSRQRKTKAPSPCMPTPPRPPRMARFRAPPAEAVFHAARHPRRAAARGE